jgi:hypothetical protein
MACGAGGQVHKEILGFDVVISSPVQLLEIRYSGNAVPEPIKK